MDPSYKSTMYGEVFKGIFENQPGVSSISIGFGRIRYNIPDKLIGADTIGQELSLGQAATQDILGFRSGGYSVLRDPGPTYTDPFEAATGTSRFVMKPHGHVGTVGMGGSALAGTLGPLFTSPKGTQGIGVFWDTEMAHRLAYHAGVMPGASRTSLIPLKQMMSEAFPELVAAGTKQSSMVGAIEASKGEGAALVRRAALEMGQPLSKLKETEQLQAMFHGASRHMGFDSFKQFLARHGVQGLSGVNYSLFNIQDPHNVTKYFGILNEIPHGVKGSTAGKALHIAGPEKLDAFTKRVRTFYGRKYGDAFESFANNLFSRASEPNDVALLMTEDRGLFIGLTGRADKYFPIAAEQYGVMQYGHQLAAVRPVYDRRTQKIMSVSHIHLREFVEGFSGQGTTNMASSLEAGYSRASKSYHYVTGTKPGVNFAGMKQPVSELGQFSFYQAMFDRGTIRVDTESNRKYGGALRKAIFAAGDRERLGPHAIAMGKGALADLVTAGGIGGSGIVDPTLYHLIKAEDTGVYPRHALSKLFLPGSFTERDYTKGLHALRGRQEIVSKSRLGRIASATAAVGYFGGSTTMGISPGDLTAQRGLGAVWSKIRGSTVSPIINYPMIIGVVGGKGSGIAGVLGESGAIRTTLGEYLTRSKRSVLSHEIELTKHGADRFISILHGDRIGPSGLDDLRSKITGGGTYRNLTGGIAITPQSRAALGLPEDARFLTTATFSSTTQKTKFSFVGSEASSASDALLMNDIRVSARSAPETYTKAMFGSLSKAVHLITSADTFAATNQYTTAFHHRTGLLGTKKGVQGGGISTFLKEYARAGGVGLRERGLQIRHTGAFNYANFERASARALLSMGFSQGQLEGRAMSTAKYGAGMFTALGFSHVDLGSLAGGAAKRADFRIFMGIGADRFRATSDILSQKSAFSMKLETLNLMAQSINAQYAHLGMKTAWQHPVWAELAGQYEATTGVRLSRTSVDPTNFVRPEGMPQSVRNLLAPLYDRHFEKSGAASYGRIDILSRKQAYEKFSATQGGINIRMMNKKGLNFGELSMTKFLDAGRQGFFLDIGDDPWLLPDAGVKPERGTFAEKGFRSKYMYVQSGAEFQKIMGGVVPSRGSYVHNVVGLISSDPRGTGIPMTGELHGAQAYFYGAWRGIAALAGKTGHLNKALLKSSRSSAAVRGRLVGQLGTGLMPWNSDVYTIGVSPDTLKMMASNVKEERELIRQARKGMLYGSVMPTPVHGTGHLTTVRVRLDEVLGTTVKGEVHLAIHPFLAWQHARDLDKDVMELMILKKLRPGAVRPEKVIRRQMELYEKQFKGWKSEVDKISVSSIAVKKAGMSLEALSQHALSYFGFGNAPPIAFMGTYSTIAFGGAVARAQDADLAFIASQQNAISGDRLLKKFTAEDMATYRGLLGSNPRKTFEEAMLLQQNVFQSGITKGTRGLESMLTKLLDISPEAADMLSKDASPLQVIAMAQAKALEWLNTMVDIPGEAVLSKVRHGLKFTGSDEQLIEHMAKQLGATYGMTAIAQAQHYNLKMSAPHVIHEALGARVGRLSKLGVLTHGATIPEEVMADDIDVGDIDLNKSQYEIRELNNRAKEAGARAEQAATKSKSAKSIFRSNWRYIAGAGVALAGLRAIAQASSQMESIASSQAPLPPVPLQGMDVPEFNPVSLGQPRASIMPVNGYHSASDVRATMGAGMIPGAIAAMQISSSSQGGNFNRLHINDSRQSASYWELQRMADARSRSDFITQYQYM